MRVAKVYSTTIRSMFLLCLYRLLLLYLYKNGIAPIYTKQFDCIDNNISIHIFGWGLFIICSLALVVWFDARKVRVSTVAIWILFLLSFAPFSVYICYNVIDKWFLIGNSIYWIMLLLLHAIMCSNSCVVPFKITTSNLVTSYRIIGIIGGVCILTVLFISAKYTGFRLNFNLGEVYSLRFEAREFPIPTLLKYIFGWSRNVIPILFCLAFSNNHYKTAIGLGFIQILSFGIDGMKMTLFLIALDFIIILFSKIYNNSHYYGVMLLGISTVSLAAVVELIIDKSNWILFLITYRMSFLPVKISAYFVDFFTNNEPDFFRSSILRRFGLSSPYSEYGINQMISGIYEGNYEINANNGLISDAVANWGMPGIVIMPIVIMLLLLLFDVCSRYIEPAIKVVLGLHIAITLENTFLLVGLLSNGIIILLLLAFAVNQIASYSKSKEFC